MTYLNDLQSAHAERVARLSAPLPGARQRVKPTVRIIPIERGRQVLPEPPKPEQRIVFIEPPAPAVEIPVRRAITVSRIMTAVAVEFGIDIAVRSQKHRYVVPRQIAMWLAQKFTGQSLPMIGRHIGRSRPYDHTTVLHGIRKGEGYAAVPMIAAKIAVIMSDLGVSL